ncbi:hypothetical protein WDZ17_09060 [Pseudokineococcus basanitobsidens]|uniref:ABC-type transport system involved in multi-copper enzyme maturation permease subunit n=1 Tax=Pseudokineococcus basanitobsidens TaxID=1926649 RepID=A0ABU8RK62_9ACTN
MTAPGGTSGTDLDAPTAGRPRRRPDLRVSARGVRTVALLELRQRLRATRWFVVLAVWVAVLVGVSLLVRAAAAATGDLDELGSLLFSAVAFLVLGMGLLVVPALTATSVNGDRADGVLAPLQVTLLSPLDVVLGKLVTAWLSALVLLAAAAPVLLWAVLAGGESLLRGLVVLVVLVVVLAAVCALGLGWSALVARPVASAVLTYVTVAALTVMAPVLFGLTTVLAEEQAQVQVRQPVSYSESGEPQGCEEQTYDQPVYRTDRTWWLLAASPVVVLADATPRPADTTTEAGVERVDPLAAIRTGVRTARRGPELEQDYCAAATAEELLADQQEADAAGAVWPWGLGGLVLLGAGAAALAARRLQVPYGELPRGTRVA